MDETKESILMACPHCGNKGRLEVYAKGERSWDDRDEIESFGMTATWFWKVLVCPVCDKEIFTRQYFFSEDLEFYDDADGIMRIIPPPVEILYPTQKRQFSHLPEKVSKSYKSALRVFHHDATAFAVMAGRTLEYMCKDKNAKGRTLDKMLVDLSTPPQDVLSKTLGEMAQKVRFFRNWGAHASDIVEVDSEDAILIREFCEAVLEHVYEAPELLKRVQARIDSLKL